MAITSKRPARQWTPNVPPCKEHGRTVGRVAALLAFTCAAAHVPVILTHVQPYPGRSLLMLLLSTACIPCAVRLWQRSAVRDWAMVTGLSAAMLALHLSLFPSRSSAAEAGMNMSAHHHMTSNAGAHVATSMNGGMTMLFYAATGLAALQVLLGLSLIVTSNLACHRRTTRACLGRGGQAGTTPSAKSSTSIQTQGS